MHDDIAGYVAINLAAIFLGILLTTLAHVFF